MKEGAILVICVPANRNIKNRFKLVQPLASKLQKSSICDFRVDGRYRIQGNGITEIRIREKRLRRGNDILTKL